VLGGGVWIVFPQESAEIIAVVLEDLGERESVNELQESLI